MSAPGREAAAPEGTAEALLPACLAGDAVAREALVRALYRAVRQAVDFAALRFGASVQSADLEDAVQQVFFALFSHDLLVLRRFRGMSGLPAYVRRVAERVALRHFHRGATVRSRFRLVFSGAETGGGGGGGANRDAGAESTDPAEVLARLADASLAESVGTIAPAADERLLAAETRDRLRAALFARLSEKGRDFYRHLFIDELDVAEICRREATNANNVYQWRNRLLHEAELAAAEIGLVESPSGAR